MHPHLHLALGVLRQLLSRGGVCLGLGLKNLELGV